MANPIFELPTGRFQDVKEIVHIRPGVVSAFVPAFGALLQGLVITFLVLLDEPFEADVTPHFVSQVVALEQKQ